MATPDLGTDFKRGIVYTSWWHGKYIGRESDRTLAKVVRPAGANWLQVIVTWYQATVSSTSIHPKTGTSTPTDNDVIHVIQHAKELGFQVMLKPHLDLEADNHHWRGQINPGEDDITWNSWLRDYAAFISYYARLAQETQADLFVVGTELANTTHRSDEWREIIRQVRSIYAGPLTYAAHHEHELLSIDWWDALDFIGVDAYYPLSAVNNPSVAELREAWEGVASELEKLSDTWKEGILFTEIGYQSRRGTSQTPWAVKTEILDLQEQANCYQAVFEALSGLPWWHGVFWWNWTTKSDQGGPRDTGYTANGKPAEDILRLNYGALPREDPSTRPLPPVDESKQLIIYQSALEPGWDNWSWNSTIHHTPDGTGPDGQAALSVELSGWGAFSVHHSGIDPSAYGYLLFRINVSTTMQPPLIAYFHDAADEPLPEDVDIFAARYITSGTFADGEWLSIRIPLRELGAEGETICRINIKNNSDVRQGPFLLGNIKFLGAITE